MWYLEQLFTGILVLAILALYIWTFDAGLRKIEKKYDENYEKLNVTSFYFKYSEIISAVFIISITIVFGVFLYVTTGIHILDSNN